MHDQPPPEHLPEALDIAYRHMRRTRTIAVVLVDDGLAVGWLRFPPHRVPAGATSSDPDERARFAIRAARALHDYRANPA